MISTDPFFIGILYYVFKLLYSLQIVIFIVVQ
jgi:hypothetical protein